MLLAVKGFIIIRSELIEIASRMGGMNEEFIAWLVSEMDERGWSQSETARRARISSGMINMVVNRQTGVGVPFCAGIAKAFGITTEEVMRRAGLLPSGGEILPQLRALNERLLQLSEEDHSAALGVLEYALKLFEGRSDRARRGPAADR
jgi:transcriptional regulator with XRE-family HTH domain